jgi:thiamine kinase-like enzyme
MKLTDPLLLKMEGRSGCKLEVLNRGGLLSVRKISKESGYNSRLLLQAEKQANFFKRPSSPEFKTPAVLGESTSNDPLTWFEMPYLHGQKYSEFFDRASATEVKQLAEKFQRYFQKALAEATPSEVDASVFYDKLDSLATTLAHRRDVDSKLMERVFVYLRKIPSQVIPVKTCHGDFTFSNMLFCTDGIYLLDFLDSFIESPLIDLVKFRQDTHFYWSLLIEGDVSETRSARIIQIFNYLDTHVFTELSRDQSVTSWYSYLQTFNLLRILPYVRQPREIEFVQRGIRSLTQIP